MRGLKMIVASTVVFGSLSLGGCRNRLQIPVDVPLAQNLGGFDVVAGVLSQKHGTASFGDAGITIGSGSITIKPDSITVTPAGGGKGVVNLQAGETLIVSARIAPVDESDVVCDQGELYGPFTVELDENYVPVSVDPSSVTLSQNTLDLLNGGDFSLCLEVTSPVTGTVTIDALTFHLGL